MREFLDELSGFAEIAIWTAGSASYAAAVASAIFPKPEVLAFIWSARRCTTRFDFELQDFYIVKKLRKIERLGFSLARSVIVDNTRRKAEQNYGNLVPIPSWEGDLADDHLLKLLPFLRQLEEAPSVRPIEKRGWYLT